MPVSITELEVALQQRFSGFFSTLIDSDESTGTALKRIEVFIDEPDVEEYPQRVFPSVSILFAGLEPDDRYQDSEDRAFVSQDNTISPAENTVRLNEEWYRVAFDVHTWTLDARSDREMIQIVESVFRQKDAFPTNDGSFYWIFRTGFTVADEKSHDRKIYHKIWSIEVLADVWDNRQREAFKVVEEIDVDILKVRTKQINDTCVPVDENNNQTNAANAVSTFSERVRILPA